LVLLLTLALKRSN